MLFARQPILDADSRLAGYELLYRGEGGSESPHAATSRVAASALSDLGLRQATGGAPAFLNVTTEFLLAMDPLPFGPDGVVLEIAADRLPDGPLLERLGRLRQHGYMLALDGYAGQPSADPLLDFATLAKVDSRNLNPSGLALTVSHLRSRGIKPIANGVDAHTDHDRCADAGFELFQGDFVCRPREVVGHNVPTASIGALRLAAGISAGDEGDVDELEKAIALDPGLSLRLLRFVNSAAFSLRHQIKSVRQAIVLLGPRTVRQWAMLLLLSGIDEKRGPLLITALSRGRTCEAIARRLGADDANAYFFTGMLSVVDAMLDQPMDEAVRDLPLSEDVVAALVDRAGGKGRTLTMAEACERGAWDDAALPSLDAGELAVLHVEALTWADGTAAGLT
ncbi:EAL and HDOD domain-containing protein [Conexibacter woesei]|uniref:EAL and HDOD domain-containing protein n=1 Tax=Conexibacter woesei TaxID=191495 RepID=UPI00040504F0|nr:HDOD domain-containing protein [Conexibacter woesei]